MYVYICKYTIHIYMCVTYVGNMYIFISYTQTMHTLSLINVADMQW